MIVDISRLPEEGAMYEGDESCAELGFEDDGLVRFSEPVHYALHVSLVSDELVVKGEVSMNAAFACSRCSEFTPLFIEEPSFLQAIELDSETQSVDLTADVREAMLLLFPAYPLCSVECKGLCPQCGINYNEKSCKCKKPADGRWSTLNDLELEE